MTLQQDGAPVPDPSAGSSASHEVFVSYAHKDDKRATALVDMLRERGFSVWWDKDLGAGARWEWEILAAIDRTRLAVVVLWSHASVKNENVLDEARYAKKRERLLLPARIDDVEPPPGFGSFQALDLRGLGSDERLLGELQARRRGGGAPDPSPWPFLVRRATRLTAVIGSLVVLLFATGILDRVFRVDTSLRFATIWARNAVLAESPRAPLTFVSVGEATTNRFGKFGAAYRGHHAELLRGLSRHGARLVAFDVYFPPPDVAAEPATEARTVELAKAIEEVRQKGMGVVVGEEKRDGTHLLIQKALSNQAPGLGYAGNLCVGLKDGYALTAILLVAEHKSLARPALSLSLAAFVGSIGADAMHPTLVEAEPSIHFPRANSLAPEIVRISELGKLAGAGVENCPFLDESADVVATLIADLPRKPRYRDGRAGVEYADLLDLLRSETQGDTGAKQQQAAEAAHELVGGRLVLVAPRFRGKDQYRVFGWHGGYVWGSELHAYAVETLFSRRTLRVVSQSAHFGLVALVMVLAGAARLLLHGDVRKRRAALALLLASSAAIVLLAAVRWDYLLDGIYPALAIVLSHLACGYYVAPLIPRSYSS
jgi:CHASE2 domain-containing sensor protein